ncbi:MAG: hypothetical protein MGG11_10435 [Trichodesmium sp. MAG_R03]|nr:hypothetical protein [Trichodesmium sp. MAG_R03]
MSSFFSEGTNKDPENFLSVAGGRSETLNGLGGQPKTTAKVAAACETSTRRGAKAR